MWLMEMAWARGSCFRIDGTDKGRCFQLVGVSHGGANDFFGGSETGQDLTGAIFAQGSHAHFPRASAQDRGRDFVVDEFSSFVIDQENLKDAEAAAMAGFGAVAATFAFHEGGAVDVIGINVEGPQLRFSGKVGG